MQDHVDSINAKHTNQNHNIRFDVLSELYEEMQSNNIYVKQVIHFIVSKFNIYLIYDLFYSIDSRY
jgi:hypothetical protein